MDTKKHVNAGILIYLFLLLAFVIENIIIKRSIIDYIYLIIVLCSVFKLLLIIYCERK